MKESTVQSKIITLLKREGAKVVKVIVSNIRGTADLLVCYRGYYIALEVKAPDKADNESRLQEVQRMLTTISGGLSLVVSSVEEVNTILEYFRLLPKLSHPTTIEALASYVHIHKLSTSFVKDKS